MSIYRLHLELYTFSYEIRHETIEIGNMYLYNFQDFTYYIMRTSSYLVRITLDFDKKMTVTEYS